MKSRPFLVSLSLFVIVLSSLVARPVRAEDELASAVDPARLGRVAKAWAYPKDNTLSIQPAIGVVFPLHVVVTQTDDSLVEVCRYYAKKCGHESFDKVDLRATGKSQSGVYLIRDHRADPSAKVPRVIFMYHDKNQTVSVTVMRPVGARQTQVDVCVSVR